jgi:hypothetical protein
LSAHEAFRPEAGGDDDTIAAALTHSDTEIANGLPLDNLSLVEASTSQATADHALGAVAVKVLDPVGSCVRFLLDRQQRVDLKLEPVAELGGLLPRS